jgi:hypothetical protein
VLQLDFDQYVSGDRIVDRATIDLTAWTTGVESRYNDSYCPNANFIVGDSGDS